jgi:hypothetical protein
MNIILLNIIVKVKGKTDETKTSIKGYFRRKLRVLSVKGLSGVKWISR